MKKIISSIIAIVMVFCLSTAAFAQDGVKLTDEQKKERAEFIGAYADKKMDLMELGDNIRTSLAESSSIAKQIKEKVKSLLVRNNQESIAKLKENAEKNKALGEEARTLNKERLSLLKDLSAALTSGDSAKAKEIKAHIKEVSDKIKAIKDQAKANSDSVSSDRQKVKEARDRLVQVKNSVQPILKEAKGLKEKIKSDYQDRNSLWETYKTNIKAKNYDAAEATLDQIIEAKNQIMADIESREGLLKKALDMLNSY